MFQLVRVGVEELANLIYYLKCRKFEPLSYMVGFENSHLTMVHVQLHFTCFTVARASIPIYLSMYMLMYLLTQIWFEKKSTKSKRGSEKKRKRN